MLLNYFGKLFFPRQAPWQQRRQLINMLASILVAMLVGGGVVAVMLFVNAKK